MNTQTKHLKRNGGFTLIELLITVVILAILAAVVYSTLAPNKDTAKSSRAISAVQDTYQKALNYQARNGNFDGFDAAESKVVSGATSQVWSRIWEDPGQVDPRFLYNSETPGTPSNPGRVFMRVLASSDGSTAGAGIIICSTSPKASLYCLRDFDGKVTYLRVPYSPSAGTILSYIGTYTNRYSLVNQTSWAS